MSTSVDLPSDYKIHVLADGQTYKVDADLDNIHVKEFPRLELADINVRVKEVPTFNSNISIKELPEIHAKTDSNVNVAIKEIPDTRIHVPANFNLGFSILGFQLANLSLCGEGQVIVEKYVPRRMELC